MTLAPLPPAPPRPRAARAVVMAFLVALLGSGIVAASSQQAQAYGSTLPSPSYTLRQQLGRLAPDAGLEGSVAEGVAGSAEVGGEAVALDACVDTIVCGLIAAEAVGLTAEWHWQMNKVNYDYTPSSYTTAGWAWTEEPKVDGQCFDFAFTGPSAGRDADVTFYAGNGAREEGQDADYSQPSNQWLPAGSWQFCPGDGLRSLVGVGIQWVDPSGALRNVLAWGQPGGQDPQAWIESRGGTPQANEPLRQLYADTTCTASGGASATSSVLLGSFHESDGTYPVIPGASCAVSGEQVTAYKVYEVTSGGTPGPRTVMQWSVPLSDPSDPCSLSGGLKCETTVWTDTTTDTDPTPKWHECGGDVGCDWTTTNPKTTDTSQWQCRFGNAVVALSVCDVLKTPDPIPPDVETTPEDPGDPAPSPRPTPTPVADPSPPTSLEKCVPSGFALLDPTAYVRATGCVMEWAFVPPASVVTEIKTDAGQVTQKPPLSWVIPVFGAVHSVVWGSCSDGPTGSCDLDPVVAIPGTSAKWHILSDGGSVSPDALLDDVRPFMVPLLWLGVWVPVALWGFRKAVPITGGD